MISKICKCGKEFETYPSRVKIGKGKYCSKACGFLALKGRVSPKRGIKLTPAQKKHLNMEGLMLGHGWNKGLKTGVHHAKQFKKGMIPWNKGLKGFMAGKSHWNWQGGITPERKRLHELYEYKKWRDAVKKRDKYTCVWCGSTENLEADHIKRWKEHPTLRHKVSNGRTLCHTCHVQTDTYGNRRIYT